jgi:hypothetical protein
VVDIEKGHLAFMEFLNTELPEIGLTHYYSRDIDYLPEVPCAHFITRIEEVELNLLIFRLKWHRSQIVAQIMAEPGTPIPDGAFDAFRVKVLKADICDKMQVLAEKFSIANFGVKAEITY